MKPAADTRGPRRNGHGRRVAIVLLACCAVGALLVGPAAATSLRRAATTHQAATKAKLKTAKARKTSAKVPAVDLACLASFQFDFSPALDNNNTVSAQTTASLANCVSPDGSRPDLNSAVLFADRGHSTATGCSPAPLSVDGVGSILWNDQTSSNFTFSVHTNPLDPLFGLTANIISGTFGGHTITAVPALISQFGLCGLGGVSSLAINFGMDIVTH